MKGRKRYWASVFVLLALSGIAMADTVTLQQIHGLA
jgi:hypothetical protein